MKKSIILLVLLTCCICSQAQTFIVELFYNVNNIQHSALCVFDGNYGRCHVLSSIGDCWFNVNSSSNGTITTYTMSNPSVYGWIPGVCYFTPNGNSIEFQGRYFGLGANVVSQHDWNVKMVQYGFSIDGTSHHGDKPVVVKGASCKHSGCYCTAYKGYQTASGRYKGNCTNTDGWGHTCNHSPEEHGLNK